MSYTNGLDNPELYFQVKLHSGDGGGGDSLTFDGDENMQPDMVWSKSRTEALNHTLFDSVRTAASNKELTPNESAAEGGADTAGFGYISAFGSDGFTWVAGGTNTENFNKSSQTYVHWCWKESATSGFDIISYTGNATNRTISHSLSAVPKMMVTKNREETDSWRVYHEGMGNTKVMYLNITEASETLTTAWNSTTPTSSVFTVGTDNGTNRDGDGMIAYLFSEKQGYFKAGSYVGNGASNTNGQFIYLGFRPAMVLVKRTNGTKDWKIFDNKRNGYNGSNEVLEPNNSDAEDTTEFLDFLSNGFRWIIPSSDAKYADVNGDGDTFIYMAFAEAPLVNSKGVPCNAR